MKLTGPRREILQGGTRLFWAAGDKQRLLSKLRTVPQNVQITYTLYKAVTNIIQMSKRISQLFILNKLNIAENIPPPLEKIRIKRLWLRLWGPFLDSQAFLDIRGPDRCTGWTPLSLGLEIYTSLILFFMQYSSSFNLMLYSWNSSLFYLIICIVF